MVKIAQLLITGITLGSIYALVALGYVTIYRTSKVVNMAQGSFVMLGGLVAFSFLNQLHWPYWLSGLAAVVIVVLIAVVCYVLVLRRLMKVSVVSVILATIGLSIMFENAALIKWGGYGLGLPGFVKQSSLSFSGAVVQTQSLWVVGVTLVMVLCLWLFTAHTKMGKQMTATASDPEAASVCGISTSRMIVLAFSISAAIGAIGGIAVSAFNPMTYQAGGIYALTGFVAAILGGWGSAAGAVLGGLALGLIQSFATGWIQAGYQDAIAYGLLLVVLYLRPQGLLGSAVIEGEV
jgi:branched-chain amino acid transport system permease protein